ncbi:MAG TPA: hypothetical protein VLR69_04155 [Thermoanaerobaculia bacterium]|nr:hypothetical protein [Thermoanaerobaculia bacterium]
MSKLFKIAAVIAVTMFVLFLAAPTTAQANQCRPVKIAFSTPCFQTQMAPFEGSKLYKMQTEVIDMGKGMMDVSFYFVPKCLDDPIPCRIATLYVGGTVDCNTGTAVCD